MGLLIDETGDFDVEIVDDKLFVYARGGFDLSSPALWQRLDRIRTVVGAKTLRQTGTVRRRERAHRRLAAGCAWDSSAAARRSASSWSSPSAPASSSEASASSSRSSSSRVRAMSEWVYTGALGTRARSARRRVARQDARRRRREHPRYRGRHHRDHPLRLPRVRPRRMDHLAPQPPPHPVHGQDRSLQALADRVRSCAT